MRTMNWIQKRLPWPAIAMVALTLASSSGVQAADFQITSATWKADRNKLIVKGTGNKDATVKVVNAFDTDQEIGDDSVSKRGKWKVTKRKPSPVPCSVAAYKDEVKNGNKIGERAVANAPANCAPKDGGSPPPANQPPTAKANGPYSGMTGTAVSFSSAGSSDSDGTIKSYSWDFGDGGSSSNANPSHDYTSMGPYNVSLKVTDNGGLTDTNSTTANISNAPPPPPVGDLITDPVSQKSLAGNAGYKVLAANDLGMHCADLDYQIFSILPPFNVVHAQVIQRGDSPNLVTPASHPNMSVFYSAAFNPNDPTFDPANPTLPPSLNQPAALLAGTARATISINSTSQNDGVASVFKGNFWDATGNPTGNSWGFDTYDNLFFGLLGPANVVADTGLPVPDSMLLIDSMLHQDLGPCLADPNCLGQQLMPGIDDAYVANDRKPFDRFDQDFNFFSGVLGAPLGSVIRNANWYAADGIPATFVDDAGRINAYPLQRVQAINNGSIVASTDVVTPVASEADCQNCHVDPIDCADERLPQLIKIQSDSCTGAAVDPGEITVATIDTAPGDTVEQQLINAAKINILRLHDVDHGADYPTGWGPVGNGCTSTGDEDCLANLTPIQCSQCHYSPALDLAQLGPTDDAGHQVFQKAVGTSMSAMMHGFHATVRDDNGSLMFPDMPAPDQSRNTQAVLEQTCYQCHPGKRTQCLRGAMASGGVVCQDCHGQMADVGLDFTTGGSRVPWASEPKCQSCHTGDSNNLNHPGGAIVADDGIRLLQAYVGNNANSPISSPGSRFAENESLFRLSGNDDGSGKGHKGIMCEGCHGSTHAIWPNANPNANDNVAANQLQGHTGSIVECDTCHTQDLGNSLDGPHGMHAVGTVGQSFANGGHEHLNTNSCKACHGQNGQGTVLATVAKRRTVTHDGETYTLNKGDQVSCDICHSNKINSGSGSDGGDD